MRRVFLAFAVVLALGAVAIGCAKKSQTASSETSSDSLLATNPFPDRPPRHVRAQYYRYEFAPPGNAAGLYWRRTLLGVWIPPLSAGDPRLRRFLTAYGWLPRDASSGTP